MLFDILERLSLIELPTAAFSKKQSKMKDTALRTISKALDETYLYYRDIEHGDIPNRNKESLLVKYWSAAAISIRHFDEILAIICDNKAEFWVNPDNYSEDDIKRLGIGLDNVRQKYRRMLKPDS